MTIDATVELFYDAAWNDVSADVDMRQPISITYGRADEQGEATPAATSLRLLNAGRTFSPKDPLSELYGKIGLSTPIRIGMPSTVALDLTLDGPDTRAKTPDHASFAVTDLDVRIEVEAPFYGERNLAGQLGAWHFFLDDGFLVYQWSEDGSEFSACESSVKIPLAPGVSAFGVTHDVDDGSGSTVITFFAADTLEGLDDPGAQLGVLCVGAFTTSIFDSSSDLRLGNSLGVDAFPGYVRRFEMRDGIGGTIVANPDFTAQADGTTSFADGAGRTWTLEGDAVITSRRPRFEGEVISWTPGYDETALDAVMDVAASGVLERLSQGDIPLTSAFHRGVIRDFSSVVAYWPCEDARGSTSIASGLSGGRPMRILRDPLLPDGGADPNFGGNTDFACSDAMMSLNQASLVGDINTGNVIQVRFLLSVPDTGTGEGEDPIITLFCTGSIFRIYLVSAPDGEVALAALDEEENILGTINTSGFDMNGNPMLVSIEAEQVGADVDWRIRRRIVGDAEGQVFGGSLLSGETLTGAQQIILNHVGDHDVGMGHVYVQAAITQTTEAADQLNAWAGETAGRRYERLTGEQNVTFLTFHGAGDLDSTAPMGAQRPEKLVDLLDECEKADAGLQSEAMNIRGLFYRSLRTLYNQEPALELDMDDGRIINPFGPPLDNQRTRNDVTVSRSGGSSARAVQTTGPRNVQSPSDEAQGVNRHEGGASVNVRSDAQLPDQAQWLRHLGTVDAHRIGSLELEMEHHTDLTDDVLLMRPGNMIRLLNPLPGLPPDDIDLLVLGWRETIENQRWRIGFNCVPAEPYRIIEVEHDRYSYVGSDASTTAGNFEAGTDTTLPVTVSPPYRWIDSDVPFDILVAGVRLTVTAISDTPPSALQNTAEGGTDGTGVTTANSGGDSGDAWDVVVTDGISTAEYTTLQTFNGSLAYAISGVLAGVTVLGWTPPNSTQVVFRAYLRLSGFPTFGQNFIRFMNVDGTVQRAALVMNELGEILIHDIAAGTVHNTSPDALAIDTWYRIEISLDTPDSTSGAMVLKIFEGDSIIPKPGFDISVSGADFGAAGVAQIRFGKATSSGTWPTQYWDDIAFKDGTLTLLGPSSAQTFTVDAIPVNGITKTIPAGSKVDIFHASYIGL